MENNRLGKVVASVFAGAVSGIAIGLLFAPDKGRKTRKKISQKGDDYLQKIKKRH